MSGVIAMVRVDTQRGALGRPSRAGRGLGGASVLSRTLHRMARVPHVSRMVLVHEKGVDVSTLYDAAALDRPVEHHAVESFLHPLTQMVRTSRLWAPGAWRGGPGTLCCYDELLPVEPYAQVLDRFDASGALLVGGDWPLVDPGLCGQIIARHLEHPEAMQMTFTQAPPGLCGICLGRELIAQLVDTLGVLSTLLAYVPSRPQADPIGKDVCCQIPPEVRSCARRLIYDNPRSVELIDHLATQIDIADADASTVVHAVRDIEAAHDDLLLHRPGQLTLELTPARPVRGPITPQAHVAIDRDPIDADTAIDIIHRFAANAGAGDLLLTLGGIGDALLHPQWDRIAAAAHEAGVASICIETDLHLDRDLALRLLNAPIDIVSIRLNADSPEVYNAVMQPTDQHAFEQVVARIEDLLNERNRRWQEPGGGGDDAGVPWIIPRLVKTAHTLPDMENFFNRWVHYCRHAVIEPATTGCGLMPEQSPVRMAPPRRRPCAQLGRRLTVLSDGCVAQCDQDWLGRARLGDARTDTPMQIATSITPVRAAHADSRWDELDLCANCHEWHRP